MISRQAMPLAAVESTHHRPAAGQILPLETISIWQRLGGRAVQELSGEERQSKVFSLQLSLAKIHFQQLATFH